MKMGNPFTSKSWEFAKSQRSCRERYSSLSLVNTQLTLSFNASNKYFDKGSLISGKYYYFKVRAYRTVSGKNIYSSYSTVKSVKVK